MKTRLLLICTIVLITMIAFASCKKDNKKSQDNNLGALNGTWGTPQWGGVSNNPLSFVISSTATTGVITTVGSSPFNFAVGDQLYSNIALTGTDNYSAMGKYTYGTNNSSSGIRACTLTLQNNNTQLIADYPALNASFPEIIYVFQKQ